MNDLLKDIKEFHEKFGLEYDGPPRSLNEELASFRARFLAEETAEYESHATGDTLADKVGVIDAMVDLVYVALGTVYLHGMSGQFDEAWRRVHSANMQKVRAVSASESKRGSTYDVVKPEGWAAPNHEDLFE